MVPTRVVVTGDNVVVSSVIAVSYVDNFVVNSDIVDLAVVTACVNSLVRFLDEGAVVADIKAVGVSVVDTSLATVETVDSAVEIAEDNVEITDSVVDTRDSNVVVGASVGCLVSNFVVSSVMVDSAVDNLVVSSEIIFSAVVVNSGGEYLVVITGG